MPDWVNLEHAYGSAGDLQELLRQLSPDPNADVWAELWSRVCHQGTVYSASFPVLPYLADAAAKWPLPARVMPLSLAAAIVISDDVVGDRASLMQGLADTVNRLQQLAVESLRVENLEREDFIQLLQATLALKGDTLWGQQLDRLASGEFEGVCPACDAYLQLVIGEYGFFVTSEEWVNKPQVKRYSIEPAEPASLWGTGNWLYERAVGAQQAELAMWVRHLFGSTVCPECERRLQVTEAIAQMAV